jgi:hypothetical protein
MFPTSEKKSQSFKITRYFLYVEFSDFYVNQTRWKNFTCTGYSQKGRSITCMPPTLHYRRHGFCNVNVKFGLRVRLVQLVLLCE